MTPNMHRKQKSKVRFLKDMLSSFEYSSSNVLAMDARILALKSIPTKHAMPATKAAKTAAYLLKWQKC